MSQYKLNFYALLAAFAEHIKLLWVARGVVVINMLKFQDCPFLKAFSMYVPDWSEAATRGNVAPFIILLLMPAKPTLDINQLALLI